ncbi:MAG: substrate-binding domain-containing protein, partial [Patescibacteria group bacterium]|nr:substrate-binding domain-containing protein [Patescibacteria group bacterium]
MQYCREHGLDVPGDVAIAGFDNLPESEVTSPPLTTVAYPIQSIARLAVQSLVDRIGRGRAHPPSHVLLEPHLVVRQSTDPAARASQALAGDEALFDESMQDEPTRQRRFDPKAVAKAPSISD